MATARRTDFDVVIVGGGMVGSCLAALIAREDALSHWRIALVDPATPRRPSDRELDLRVSALSRASERILAAARAWEGIEPYASAYGRMVVWDAASTHERPDALRFSAAETAEPDLGHIVENLRIQWALHESPYLRAVTEVRSGLQQLEFEEDCARVTLEDGRRLSCQLVVGADGGQSVARKLAGIGQSGWTYGQTAVVAHLATERPHRETAWQRFLPSGPLALLPLGDGRVSLVWSTSPAEADALLACGEVEFNERVTVASDHVLGAATLASPRAGFPLALWHAREYVRPRLALVGDAAHTIHPLAGQGVNLGFLDCASLVQVLAEAAGKGEELHGLRVLRRYERWRRSENALVLALCDTLNRLFSERSVAVAAVRRFGMSVVTQQPLLRRALIERALGLGGDVPALALRANLRGIP
ncbi:MAG TPA: FAD-dependent monooxygenase [Steroidobacteraceae bacterium]|nr:FAD-dependent monooxygenase [Steroidobacteraceae bacterium]